MTTPTSTWRRSLVALAVAALVLAGCGDDDTSDDATPTTVEASTDDTTSDDTTTDQAEAPSEQPVVVASTSWVAAFARAAGIDEVAVVAPADLQHPPDYDPRPSDLVAVAEADYVLLAGFEGFAERLTEATGSDAELVTITAENTPDNIRTQVRSLAATFGTTDAAEEWIAEFDERLAEMQEEIDAARPDDAPTAIAHVFMASWADLAGSELVGTYGPAPATAGQLAELTAAAPELLFANAHVPAGDTFADLGAIQIDIVNFPDGSLDLIEVFETNTASIVEAFGRL